MPLHRTPYDRAHEYVAELEQQGLRVLSVAPDGDGLWVVTEPKPRVGRPPKETR